MSRRQSLFAYFALLVGVLTFASSFARPTAGQIAVSAPPVVGRYQIATTGEYNSHYVYTVDTVTGKIFRAYHNHDPAKMEWDEVKSSPFVK